MKVKHFVRFILVVLLVQVLLLIYMLTSLDDEQQSAYFVQPRHIKALKWLHSCKCRLEPLPNKTETSRYLVRPYHPGGDVCDLETNSAHSTPNISLPDLLENMQISYPKYVMTQRGFMDQWDIKYNPKEWDDKILQVVIVPHSHNDPGWLYSEESYYADRTSRILTRVLEHLSQDSDVKFIWSELCHLSRWYHNLRDGQKQQFKTLLANGQLEIVSGGWVMPDEAVTHYHDLILQLQEGHLWLKENFNYTVKNGWAIDPFGHLATMPFLMKRSGVQRVVIQRAHYAFKHHLGNRKQLDFLWTQSWDNKTTGIHYHLMPFLLYSIAYSCGPDFEVCCQFDFTHKKCWMWGEDQPAEPITDLNLKQKAELLLDQYRKKAQLSGSNVILVPHGDDFRYRVNVEWKAQFENLRLLMAYMNENHEMRVNMTFGTLADYFAAVEMDNANNPQRNVTNHIPVLEGDFLSYSDRGDQYWSGYYTSRPFLKSMIRQLQNYLRSAEILFTLTMGQCQMRQFYDWKKDMEALYQDLESVRNRQSLLQHHDAITGTSRRTVIKDYLGGIGSSLILAKKIITTSVTALLRMNTGLKDKKLINAYADIRQDNADANELPTIQEIFMKTPTRILGVFNQETVAREELIKLKINEIKVAVFDSQGQSLSCQLNPVWMNKTRISHIQFELVFLAKLGPLSISHFVIEKDPQEGDLCVLADVVVYNYNSTVPSKHFDVRSTNLTQLSIENKLLRASYCPCTGLLQSVYTKTNNILHRTEMRFAHYSPGSWSNPLNDKSGAYIFAPEGPAQDISPSSPPVLVAVQGPVTSEVMTHYKLASQKVSISHTEELLASSLLIENLVDISTTSNFELAMRVYTDLESKDGYFYTDVNSFQVHRRRHLSRLPLQGNVYPMTSSVWLEDSLFRVSLLSAQSHGVSSSIPGMLEVILDRRLMQDDWRGLREGVKDNLLTLSSFRLLIEMRHAPLNPHNVHQSLSGFPSMLSHLTNHMLNSPPITLLQLRSTDLKTTVSFDPLAENLPCDYRLVTLRSQSSDFKTFNPLLVVHRVASSCHFRDHFMQCPLADGELNFRHFTKLPIREVNELTLSGMTWRQKVDVNDIDIKPMEIMTYELSMR